MAFFCPHVEAAIIVTLKPEDPSVVQEFQNISLVWNYTLGAAFDNAKFLVVGEGGGSSIIARRSGVQGSTNVAPSFQDRFRADISDTKAWLTILTVQRADKGIYRFEISDANFANFIEDVNVDVHCKLSTSLNSLIPSSLNTFASC